jgi:hypothetical protein
VLRPLVAQVLRPFMMRRLKESVATELPKKVGGLMLLMLTNAAAGSSS